MRLQSTSSFALKTLTGGAKHRNQTVSMHWQLCSHSDIVSAKHQRQHFHSIISSAKIVFKKRKQLPVNWAGNDRTLAV